MAESKHVRVEVSREARSFRAGMPKGFFCLRKNSEGYPTILKGQFKLNNEPIFRLPREGVLPDCQ